MTKKSLLQNKKRLLAALGLALVFENNSVEVKALNGDKIEEAMENSKFLQFFEDIDNTVNEKLDNFADTHSIDDFEDTIRDGFSSVQKIKDDLIDYDHSNLQIVSFTPDVDPNLEREYYFVNSLVPALRSSYYLDENGYRVDKNSNQKRYYVKVKKHHTITEDENDSKFTFEEKTTEDLLTHEVWTNTTTLTKEMPYLQDETDNISFGVFEDISDVLPSEYVKEEYTLKEIKDYTKMINDIDNPLAFSEEEISLKLNK